MRNIKLVAKMRKFGKIMMDKATREEPTFDLYFGKRSIRHSKKSCLYKGKPETCYQDYDCIYYEGPFQMVWDGYIRDIKYFEKELKSADIVSLWQHGGYYSVDLKRGVATNFTETFKIGNKVEKAVPDWETLNYKAGKGYTLTKIPQGLNSAKVAFKANRKIKVKLSSFLILYKSLRHKKRHSNLIPNK